MGDVHLRSLTVALVLQGRGALEWESHLRAVTLGWGEGISRASALARSSRGKTVQVTTTGK